MEVSFNKYPKLEEGNSQNKCQKHDYNYHFEAIRANIFFKRKGKRRSLTNNQFGTYLSLMAIVAK